MSDMKFKKTATGVTLDVRGSPVDFSAREVQVGRYMYYIFVVILLEIAGATAWTISDIISPTGKWADFWSLNSGVKIAVIGIIAFVVFLLLVIFYGMHRKGIHVLTKAIFASKKLYRDTKGTKIAQVVTGGLMVSIFILVLGVIVFIIEMAGGTGPAIVWLVPQLTTGEILLAIGMVAIGIFFIAVSFAWLWSVGNIFFAKALLKVKAA